MIVLIIFAHLQFETTINQSNIIHITVHKCMLKNLQDYQGNKVVFVQVKT